MRPAQSSSLPDSLNQSVMTVFTHAHRPSSETFLTQADGIGNKLFPLTLLLTDTTKKIRRPNMQLFNIRLRECSLFIDGVVRAEIYFRRYSLFDNWNTLFLGQRIHF